MADKDEDPVDRQLASLAAPRVAQRDRGDLPVLVAADLLDDRIPDRPDLLVRQRALLQDLRGTEFVAAVDQVDRARVPGGEQRLFDRRVAATDDGDHLVLEEGRVAGRAVRDSAAGHRLLPRYAQLHRVGAAGDNRRLRAHFAVDGRQNVVRPIPAQPLNAAIHRLHPELLGLAVHVDGKVWALHAVSEAGIILDQSRDRDLPSEHPALPENGAPARARRVEAGGETSRPPANDRDVDIVHDPSSSSPSVAGPRCAV